jgi:hypothetical protein
LPGAALVVEGRSGDAGEGRVVEAEAASAGVGHRGGAAKGEREAGGDAVGAVRAWLAILAVSACALALEGHRAGQE